MTLWCQRDDQIFDFTVSVGIPVQIDSETWECSWSLGELLNHTCIPLKNLTSLLCLATTIRFISRFLEGRHEAGDRFFFDADLNEAIDNIPALFFGDLPDEGVALNTCPAASSIRDDDSTINPQSKPRPQAGVRGLRR